MKLFLSQTPVQVSANAKAILIGEHAAVYGFPALAVSLPDISLKLSLHAPSLAENMPESWTEAFQVSVRGEALSLSDSAREKLVRAFATCIEEAGCEFRISDFRPQRICVESEIPLGAGLGGSAALSTAFVRLLDVIRGRAPGENVAERANRIDTVFHGVASGLDTAAIASNGVVVEFVKGRGSVPVFHARTFWLVLIDSGERAATSDMVRRVAELRVTDPAAEEHLRTLGRLATQCRLDLESGDITALGERMNLSHERLQLLQVSTPRLDKLAEHLRDCGAIGAKLTGAGGGGIVLGLFAEDPLLHLENLAREGQLFYTKVEATRREETLSVSGRT